MDAQFDSHSRAAGHSYTKYNNWETVPCTRGFDRHCFGNGAKNITLIHKSFPLVDRGLD